MPYTPTNWINGTMALNQTAMNNLESQYTEATNSYNPDLFTSGFVLTGLFCSKDGSISNQLDFGTGVYYALQADGTTRRRALSASHFTTSVASTTYYFDANPDGTTSWGTAHSGQTNYLPICQVTTDASGNILTVTDMRNRTATLWPNLIGTAGDTGGKLGFGATTVWGSSLSIDQLGSAVGTAQAQPTAPTLALAAGGSMGTGAYQYVVTLMSVNGESQAGAIASITTTSGNNTVNLTNIPTGPTGTIGRNIYRTAVGGSVFKLLRTLHDNTTTTYTDTNADGNLNNQNPPAHPTMGADVWKNSGGSTVAAVFADGAAQFQSIASLNGQATGGAFGVPPIINVWQVSSGLTGTTLHSLAAITVPSTGIYRFVGAIYPAATGNNTITFYVSFTSAYTNGTELQWFVVANGTSQQLNALTISGPIDYQVSLGGIYVLGGTTLTPKWQNGNGIATSDQVYIIMERLA